MGKSETIYKLRKIIHVPETLVNRKATILVYQFLLASGKKFQQVKDASDNHKLPKHELLYLCYHDFPLILDFTQIVSIMPATVHDCQETG